MVRFEQVGITYPNGVMALGNVTLSIAPGEFVFLTGTTGAGKSTLLKMIYAEHKPTSGRVWLGDTLVSSLRPKDVPALRRTMGIVPQDFGLLPNKRVWENLAYSLRVVGMTKKEIRRRVPEILERVGIIHCIDSYPSQLSGGEAQRACIARALAHNPSLLLADEPTGNLDADTSWGIIQLLDQINARGATVIVASHDQAVIERIGRREVRLDRGEVVADSGGTGILPLAASAGPGLGPQPDDGITSIEDPGPSIEEVSEPARPA